MECNSSTFEPITNANAQTNVKFVGCGKGRSGVIVDELYGARCKVLGVERCAEMNQLHRF